MYRFNGGRRGVVGCMMEAKDHATHGLNVSAAGVCLREISQYNQYSMYELEIGNGGGKMENACPFLSHNKDEVETEKEIETRQLLHVDGKHASLHALFPVWGTTWRISFILYISKINGYNKHSKIKT